MENWQYHKTYSGTPQGSGASPLLANIYLHELDKFVMKLKTDFDTTGKKKVNPEYSRSQSRNQRLSKRIEMAEGAEKAQTIA